MMHDSYRNLHAASRRSVVRQASARPDGRGGPDGDDERRKAARFQRHHEQADPIPGHVQGLDPGRDAVRHRFDRLLHRRSQDPGQGHHQAVRRRDGTDRRHRRGSISPISATSSCSRSACICSRPSSATSRAGSCPASR